MNVIKFGGISIVNTSSIKKVINIIYEKQKHSKDVIVIVISSIKGITDKLIECGSISIDKNDEKYKDILKNIEKIYLDIIKDLFPIKKQSHIISFLKRNINKLENIYDSIFQIKELSKRSLDNIMSFGEIISSYIIYQKIKLEGINVCWKDSREIIITDNNFGSAKINFSKTKFHINEYFNNNKYKCVIVPGFIGSTNKKITTTLGRGGSDYTAAILALYLNTKILEIWTSVSGVMTADPKIVNQAFPIKNISYEEAIELSHFGTKIICPKSVELIAEKNITINIKNILSPHEEGSYIKKDKKIDISEPVTGISGIQNISLLTLKGNGIIHSVNYSKKLFEIFFYKKINIIFITQSSPENSITLGICIDKKKLYKLISLINNQFHKEIYDKKIEPIKVYNNLCIIAIVGSNMKNLHGTSGKMFSTLGKNNINIKAIAQGTTEKNISAVIEDKNFKKAINILHEVFFENPVKQINIFIVGLGQVGSKLIEQIYNQYNYLIDKLKLQLKIIGITNSKKMLFNKQNGIDLSCWNSLLLNKGEDYNINKFINKIEKFNLRNSLFIDNTSSKKISMTYENFLKKGIGIVTCNKIACSYKYYYYKNLKILSRHFNAPFLFETNVGAGLPIISTLNDLINSGDKIFKIEAVLSGSLNFIFNNFKKGITFSNVIKKAKEKGYTEPDPRIDLSGVDVMRKILILSRECGNIVEINDIIKNDFLPEECLKTSSINEFYNKLEKNSEYFDEIRNNANAENKRLRFIAKYDNGKSSIGLEKISYNHPFYDLEGKDNMVLYFTYRYSDQPLIIKGAGAGAEVTASGVFSDIIKASR